MSSFERYLSVWVFLCIVTGIVLGQSFTGLIEVLGRMEVAQVNIAVGLLIWVMIIPMLVKIDFGALHQVRAHWKGIGVTLLVNWAVKPFTMAFLGWLFIRNVFAPYLPAAELDSYIAGLIILAAAPCTAMVFVWSKLTDGGPVFHTVAGGLERRHHDFRVRANRCTATRNIGDYGALADAVYFSGALHRHSGGSCPVVAQGPAGTQPDCVRRHNAQDGNLVYWRVAAHPSFCCLRSRVKQSWSSR